MLTLSLMLATPPVCTDVKRQRRACTTVNGRRRCSGVGIACQPVVRLCRPKPAATRPPAKRAG